MKSSFVFENQLQGHRGYKTTAKGIQLVVFTRYRHVTVWAGKNFRPENPKHLGFKSIAVTYLEGTVTCLE
jgi:hypothetical protein